jgi:hypothetical protein
MRPEEIRMLYANNSWANTGVLDTAARLIFIDERSAAAV